MDSNTLALETQLTARFVSSVACNTPEEQQSLDTLNHAVEDVTERLQGTFRLLIIEMLTLKREALTGGETDARPK